MELPEIIIMSIILLAKTVVVILMWVHINTLQKDIKDRQERIKREWGED